MCSKCEQLEKERVKIRQTLMREVIHSTPSCGDCWILDLSCGHQELVTRNIQVGEMRLCSKCCRENNAEKVICKHYPLYDDPGSSRDRIPALGRFHLRDARIRGEGGGRWNHNRLSVHIVKWCQKEKIVLLSLGSARFCGALSFCLTKIWLFANIHISSTFSWKNRRLKWQ